MVIGYNGLPEPVYCECCAPRRFTSTATAGHVWTRDEIVDEMLYWAKAILASNMWSRGHAIERLKHWTEKLERYNKAVEEFELPALD